MGATVERFSDRIGGSLRSAMRSQPFEIHSLARRIDLQQSELRRGRWLGRVCFRACRPIGYNMKGI